MLYHERIDARLSDAEMLVMSGADIGDPHGFLRGLWVQVYDHAPMHLRSSVLRRLHALSRRLGVNYVHGEPDARAGLASALQAAGAGEVRQPMPGDSFEL